MIDRHEVVRAGIRLLLEAEGDLRVVGEADEAVGVDLESADVVVVEPLGQEIVLDTDVPVVILTAARSVASAAEAMRRGVAGYVPKDAAPKQLVRAVRMAAGGLTYLEPRLGARLAAARESVPELTDREVDVLRLIARGHTNGEIAARLHRSVRTVEGHRARIQRKLGRSRRAELVEWAAERGLGDQP